MENPQHTDTVYLLEKLYRAISEILKNAEQGKKQADVSLTSQHS